MNRVKTYSEIIIDCEADSPKTEAYIFKKFLFGYICFSRRDTLVEIGAANAMMILNAAKVPFSYMNLSKIRIPGANLSTAVFDHSNLIGANLDRVNLDRAFLGHAQMDKDHMDKNEFILEAQIFISCVQLEDHLVSVVSNETSVSLYQFNDFKLHLIWKKHHNSPITCMSFSKREGLLILCDINRKIVLWNLSNDQLEEIESDAIVTAIAIHPKEHEIVVIAGNMDGSGTKLQIWSLNSKQIKSSLDCNMIDYGDVCYIKDGAQIVCPSEHGVLFINAMNIVDIFALDCGFRTSGLRISDDESKMIVTGLNFPKHDQSGFCIFDLKNQCQEMYRVILDVDSVKPVFVSSDVSLILTLDSEGITRISTCETPEAHLVLRGNQSQISSCIYLGNRQIVCIEKTGHTTIHSLGLITHESIANEGHLGNIDDFDFSSDGQMLITTGRDYIFRLWDTRLGIQRKMSNIQRVHGFIPENVRFCNNDQDCVSTDSIDTIIRFNIVDFSENQRLEFSGAVGEKRVFADCNGTFIVLIRIGDSKNIPGVKYLCHKTNHKLICLDRSKKCAVTQDENDRILIWNIYNVPYHMMTLPPVRNCVCLSDSGLIASVYELKIQIWDLKTQQLSREIEVEQEVLHLSFLDDYLAVGYRENVEIWSLETNFAITLRHSFIDLISQNSRYLAIGTTENSIRIWDCNTWERIWTIEGQNGGISKVLFNSKDQLLVVDEAATLKFWTPIHHENRVKWMLKWVINPQLYVARPD